MFLSRLYAVIDVLGLFRLTVFFGGFMYIYPSLALCQYGSVF